MLTIGDLRQAIENLPDQMPVSVVTDEVDFDFNFRHVRRGKAKYVGVRVLASPSPGYWFEHPDRVLGPEQPQCEVLCIGDCPIDLLSGAEHPELQEE